MSRKRSDRFKTRSLRFTLNDRSPGRAFRLLLARKGSTLYTETMALRTHRDGDATQARRAHRVRQRTSLSCLEHHFSRYLSGIWHSSRPTVSGRVMIQLPHGARVKESTVISSIPGCFIELIHRRTNPTIWIVKRSKRRFWIKKQVSSHWFISADQAQTFALTMKRRYQSQLA